MYGLEAINANNGWSISVVGVSIVFSGLVMLSIVISQLYKVLALLEDPSRIKAFFKLKKVRKKQAGKGPEKQAMDRETLNENQKEIAKQFDLLAGTMQESFSLPRLLLLARISDLKDPYSNLDQLLKTKIIVPDGSGFFSWDKDRFGKTIS
ncbi:MAG: OadG family protein [Deltaproteobacteria bacterium]|nr:OadG family protein [Deltaproteobacteria bacterium]